MAKRMFRQGDILLVEGTSFQPYEDDHIVAGGVVLSSDTSGHKHRIEGAGVVWNRRWGSVVVLVTGPAQLVHEEHAAIALPVGTWEIVRQRVYAGEGRTANVRD